MKFLKILTVLALLIGASEAVLAQATNFGMSPVGSTQTMSVTTGSSTITLNSSPGNTLLIQNTGSNTAFVKCASSAATTDFPVQAGWGIALDCPSGHAFSAITSSSTTSLYVSQGLGDTAITGGGSGGGGSGAGNGLVQTSPPSYSNGASEPVTLNQQGALPAASLNLGAFTCSTLCGTTNRTLLSVNTFGYTTFSLQQTATDGSLLEIDVSYDGGTTWSQLPLEVYYGQGSTNSNGQFSNFIPTFGTPAVCARIPNPGGLIRVYAVSWNSGTFTEQVVLSHSDSCAKPVSIAAGGVSITDLNGNGNIPPVVCGSAVSTCALKTSAGYLYEVQAECSAACWLMIFNSSSAPTNGSTTAGIASGNMQECVPITLGGQGSRNYLPGPPSFFANGIYAAISSTGCATLTLATTGFVHGSVR